MSSTAGKAARKGPPRCSAGPSTPSIPRKGRLGGPIEARELFSAVYADYYRDLLEALVDLRRGPRRLLDTRAVSRTTAPGDARRARSGPRLEPPARAGGRASPGGCRVRTDAASAPGALAEGARAASEAGGSTGDAPRPSRGRHREDQARLAPLRLASLSTAPGHGGRARGAGPRDAAPVVLGRQGAEPSSSRWSLPVRRARV